ncbi:MAG: hypothetical protein AB1671_13965 [Thermodesulfobacteriota bacterium]|jgi:predicted metal-binding protein
MHTLAIYICTKSKCTARRAHVKLWAADQEAQSYNGPGLLAALRTVVAEKHLARSVAVHEAACMSGCPVGPRLDISCGPKRVMYFQRTAPTGREDLITWSCVDSIENMIEKHLTTC